MRADKQEAYHVTGQGRRSNQRRHIRCLWLLSLSWLLLGSGCASTALPPVGADGHTFEPEDDERRLWTRGREAEERLNKSGWLYTDAALETYINTVAQRLLPEDIAAQGVSIRVRVLQNPLANAFALPHGVLYLHTGILAEMENEAQLATLLGHEMAHVTHRHAVRNFRSRQNTTAFISTLQTTLVGAPFGSFAALLGSVGAVGSMFGYARSLEQEADTEGIQLLVRANYDPAEAPKFFVSLRQATERDWEKQAPFFFSTHPRLQERIDSYNELLQSQYQHAAQAPGRVQNVEVFRAHLQPLLLDNARLALQAGRFQTAQLGLDKFRQRQPHHPQAWFLLGEVLRQEGKPDKLDAAIKAYEAAIAQAPSFPDPYRGLGLLYYKHNRPAQALPLFDQYLRLAPEAQDRDYIEVYRRQLQTEGNR